MTVLLILLFIGLLLLSNVMLPLRKTFTSPFVFLDSYDKPFRNPLIALLDDDEKPVISFEQYRLCLLRHLLQNQRAQVVKSFASIAEKCNSTISMQENMNLNEYPYFQKNCFIRWSPQKITEFDECHIIAISSEHDLRTLKAIKPDAPSECLFSATDPLGILPYQSSVPPGIYPRIAVGLTKLKLAKRFGLKRSFRMTDLVTFMRSNVQVKRIIDVVLITTEEYAILESFYKGNELDTARISVCQINFLFRVPSNYKDRLRFADIQYNFLLDNKYIPIRIQRTTDGEQLVFYLNISDDLCIQRYMSDVP